MSDQRLTPLGRDTPNCPYCGQDVQKVQGYRNCPHCGQYIHACKRPYDKKYVLLTDEERLCVDEQWAIEQGYHEHWLQERLRFEAESARLVERLSREPTEYEVKMSLLWQEQEKVLGEGHYGIYCTCLSEESKLAREAKDWNRLLTSTSKAVYLSANGPNNNTNDRPIARRFNTKIGHISDGAAQNLMMAAIMLNLSPHDLEAQFLSLAEDVKQQFRTRILPKTVWSKLRTMMRRESREWVEHGTSNGIWWIDRSK